MMQRRSLLEAAAAASLGSLGLPGCALSPPSEAALQRIAIGSCVYQELPQPIWQGVLASQPDLFIFGGDNVYASKQPWTREALDKAYAQLARQPDVALLRERVPHLAIWDDHDYGLNDGGAAFTHKSESKAAFLDFWRAPPDDERRQHEGLYMARSFGPAGRRVQLILLDTRWFRSPWTDTDQRGAPGKERYVPDSRPGLTLLGETQWRWLEARLREPADLRLIVSSIQLVVDGHGFERWGLFPLERQRFYELVGRTGAAGVVLLSGDRHIGAIYRETQGTPYPMYELTASGLTHPWKDAREPGPNRLGDLFTEQHFGMVEIDWAARRLQLQLRDVRGETRQQQSIELKSLLPRRGVGT